MDEGAEAIRRAMEQNAQCWILGQPIISKESCDMVSVVLPLTFLLILLILLAFIAVGVVIYRKRRNETA